jgi:hypothetical protein
MKRINKRMRVWESIEGERYTPSARQNEGGGFALPLLRIVVAAPVLVFVRPVRPRLSRSLLVVLLSRGLVPGLEPFYEQLDTAG